MRISILVPTYNEQDTIVTVLERVTAVEVPEVEFEVIVIDDGSSDDTVKILEKKPQLYSELVRRERNGGKGAAVRDGLNKATGDYILFQDADFEYDPSDYRTLVRPVLEQNADAVIGSRNLAPTYVRVHYFWHLVGNRLITLIFNLLYNLTFTDIYSCYLLYRRNLIAPGELNDDGWAQHAEILCTIARRGSVFYEVPVNYAGRTYAEGKKIRSWHAISVIWMIIKKRFGPIANRRA